MIFSKSKQVKEMPQTLQIKKKAIAVIKLVLKMITSAIYQVTTAK
jgi:hypothetical protein